MATGVAADRGWVLDRIFGRPKAAIGVVHCAPSRRAAPPRRRHGRDRRGRARGRGAYAEGGIDGLIIENHGDIPFLRPRDIGPETAAMMAVITERVRAETGLPLGINVLANGAIMALAVAKAGGAAFIRVNQWANAYIANEGFVEGDAALALRYRARSTPRTWRSSPTAMSSTAPTPSPPTARSRSSPATSSSSTRTP